MDREEAEKLRRLKERLAVAERELELTRKRLAAARDVASEFRDALTGFEEDHESVRDLLNLKDAFNPWLEHGDEKGGVWEMGVGEGGKAGVRGWELGVGGGVASPRTDIRPSRSDTSPNSQLPTPIPQKNSQPLTPNERPKGA